MGEGNLCQVSIGSQDLLTLKKHPALCYPGGRRKNLLFNQETCLLDPLHPLVCLPTDCSVLFILPAKM